MKPTEPCHLQKAQGILRSITKFVVALDATICPGHCPGEEKSCQLGDQMVGEAAGQTWKTPATRLQTSA